jgi:hypothetical protein
MTSALAMVLAAAMAVPGSGTEAVSGETEQGLDLRGRWEGVYINADEGMMEARLLDGGIGLATGEGGSFVKSIFSDEGGGKVRFILNDAAKYLGIYEQQGDRVVICFRFADDGWPSSIRIAQGQHLLILHRVKPRK